MPVYNLQSNTNRGELDPRLVSRIDIDAYYNGLSSALNMLPIPQGGIKRRSGMLYLGTALGEARIESFSFNTEQNYLLVFSNLRLQIYKDGVLQTNINGSGNPYVVTPWTTAQIAEIDYIQSADTAIVVHPNVAPYTITRTSHTAWAVATITFTKKPQFDFEDTSSPTPVSEVQVINFRSHQEGDRYKISLEGVLTEEIVFASDDTTNRENIRRALQELPLFGSSGVSVATTTTMDTYTVTLAGASAGPWNLMSVTGIATESASFGATITRTATGTSRAEDVWSATRGWPGSATFHEGRLWFGGSSSRPSTIWGSRVNDFFNFDDYRALDDVAISATIDTDQVNAITNIFSNRSLQIFTTGGEFYIGESPITPSNVAIKPQTNFGSLKCRPVTIDGVTLYTQRSGKAINQFVYSELYQANESRAITTAAAHLVNTPVKMAVSRGTEETDANYVYILMSDGTVTVFNTLVTEEVQGFTPWITNGEIVSIATVGDVAYFCVKRVINSATVYYIEKESSDVLTDASVYVVSGMPTDTLSTLSHLEGEEVQVKADGAYMGLSTVDSGSVVITRDATTSLEAGLSYDVEAITMPLNVQTTNGPSAMAKKKIQRVAVRVYESNGVIVNGQRLADKTIGVDQFDPPVPYTGIKRIHVLGWTLDAQVTITQEEPMPMTILGIGVEVAT